MLQKVKTMKIIKSICLLLLVGLLTFSCDKEEEPEIVVDITTQITGTYEGEYTEGGLTFNEIKAYVERQNQEIVKVRIVIPSINTLSFTPTLSNESSFTHSGIDFDGTAVRAEGNLSDDTLRIEFKDESNDRLVSTYEGLKQ